MRSTSGLFLLVLFIFAAPVSAELEHQFQAAPALGLWFGDTRFELEFPDGRSELIFPVDYGLAGLELGWEARRDGHAVWSGRVRFQTNLGDPGEKFTDEDWIQTDFMGLFKFSSTESTVEARLLEFEAELTRSIWSGEKSNLALVFGFGYQHYKMDAVDLTGWQNFPADTEFVFYEIDLPDVRVLSYEVRYIRPYLGVMPTFRLGRSVSFNLRAAATPVLYAKDIDDHVLRYFQSRADGNGIWLSGRTGLTYQSPNQIGLKPMVRLEGEVNHARVEVTGRREYYGDNQGDGFLAGEGYGEKRTLSSTQYGGRLLIGLTF